MNARWMLIVATTCFVVAFAGYVAATFSDGAARTAADRADAANRDLRDAR
ncbi:MAG: hypothetical protein JWM86_571, partial [Thermoleophilia bacterium]|nr:hypothetical protein [Thermoleophilia bacterium]